MTDVKFQNKYRIPSARTTFHNYDGGMYFVTICMHHFVHYFGEIENGEMRLNELGKYAEECLNNMSVHFPDAEIPLSVVMPNHIHAIVCIDGDRNIGSRGRDAACHVSTSTAAKNINMQETANKCGRLSTVVGAFKSAVTRFANCNNIPFKWQTRFHDRIIRTQHECNKIADYIGHNPENWNSDELNML